jgi:cytochrome c oxidase cbb3-type subunit 1
MRSWERMTDSLVDGRLVRNFIVSSLIWFLAAIFVGLIISLKLLYPDFLGHVSWLSYGRMRLVHTNGVAFGWLSTLFIGVAYYLTPRLTGVPMLSGRLAKLTLWLWNAALVATVVTLLAGYNQGLEYAEMSLPVDALIVAVLVMVLINVLGTVFRRKEEQLYVSLWYLCGGLVWTVLNYAVGNTIPYYFAAGVNGAAISGFYIHNTVGLWITPMGLAIAYYLFPVLTRTPLYSHKLSILGFWTLAFLYPFTGAHHFIYSAIPQWVQTVAIVASVLLMLPVWTVLTNFFGTMKGNWYKALSSVPLKFLIAGALFYLITCIQGPLQSLATLQPILHFTDWVVGHAHMALLGAFSFWAVAAIYVLIPALSGRELWSNPLSEAHFWLTLIPVLIFFMALWAVGLIEGTMWSSGVSFYTPIHVARPYWLVRTVSGSMVIAAQVLFVINIFKTLSSGKPVVRRA